MLSGWGLFILATGIFFLLRYQARKLDEREVLRWQSNWERRREYRRPIRDFATLFLKGAERISFANRLVGVIILAVPIFICLALLGLLAMKAHYLLALALLEIGFLLPAYLGAKMIARGLRLLGEKILTLASNPPNSHTTRQRQES